VTFRTARTTAAVCTVRALSRSKLEVLKFSERMPSTKLFMYETLVNNFEIIYRRVIVPTLFLLVQCLRYKQFTMTAPHHSHT
jgi:hypothetical protein